MPKQFLLTLIISAFSMSAMAQIDPAKIPGSWKVTDFKVEMDDISEDNVGKAKKEALSTVYSLQDDGQSIMTTSSKPEGYSGRWTYNERQRELTIQGSDQGKSKPEIYVIQKLTGSKMVWTKELPNDGSMKLALERE